MAQRAKRPCGKFGCPGLCDPPQKYCSDHATLERAHEQQHDRWRGSAASRGYDADWVRARQQALQRDFHLCVFCKKENRVTSAVDVDHIIPVKIAPDRRLDVTNLQSLCRSHHQRKTAEDIKKYGT